MKSRRFPDVVAGHDQEPRAAAKRTVAPATCCWMRRWAPCCRVEPGNPVNSQETSIALFFHGSWAGRAKVEYRDHRRGIKSKRASDTPFEATVHPLSTNVTAPGMQVDDTGASHVGPRPTRCRSASLARGWLASPVGGRCMSSAFQSARPLCTSNPAGCMVGMDRPRNTRVVRLHRWIGDYPSNSPGAQSRTLATVSRTVSPPLSMRR